MEQNEQIKTLQPPSFPKQLLQPRLPTPLPHFDVLDELRNAYFRMPLLQVIKDIPIYTKAIKEPCFKKPAKKIFGPKKIHVIGCLAGLMSNIISMEKYVDPGIPRVNHYQRNFNSKHFGRFRSCNKCHDIRHNEKFVANKFTDNPNCFGIS